MVMKYVLFILLACLLVAPADAQNSANAPRFRQRIATLWGDSQHPPDVAFAVGPDRIVTGANTLFSLTSKSGTLLETEYTYRLFGISDLHYVGDPRCTYDPAAERFFCVVFYVNLGDLPTGLLLAMSKSSEPQSLSSQDWEIFELRLPDEPGKESAETELRTDFNAISVTGSDVVLTTNMNRIDESGNGHTRVVLVNKRALLEDHQVVRDADQAILLDGHFSPTIPVVSLDETNEAYLVTINGEASRCTITLFWFDDDLVLNRHDITGNFGCAETGRLAPQGDTNLQLYYEARNRTRPMLRDGKLYLVAGTPVAGTGDGPTGLRWVIVNVAGDPESARIEQSGYVTVPDTWLIFAEVAANAQGDFAQFFNATSAALRPAFCYTGRHASDPSGQMPTPICPLVSSVPQAMPEHGGESGSARYGDYCSAAIDPTDDTLWGACEVIQPNGNWSTWALQLDK